MKKRLIWIAMLAFTFVLVACAGDNDNNGANDNGNDVVQSDENANGNENITSDPVHIEIISKGFQHDFWQAVYAGARQAAEEHGATINFVGPPSEDDISDQVQMLSTAINLQPDAIAFAALDTDASMDELYRAMNNGIPIIGFDSGVPGAPEGSILADAATDNYAAGALGATSMYEVLDLDEADGVVRIGVLAQEVVSLSNSMRAHGFTNEMYRLLTERFGEGQVAIVGHTVFENDVNESDAVAIIEVRVPAEATAAAGSTEVLTLLNREDLIGIFGANEFAGNAIVTAADGLTDPRIGNDVVAIGFDSGTLQQAAVRSGLLYGGITQDPVSMGYQVVYLAIRAARGESVESVDTGARLFYAGNIDDDDIQALLYD